MSIKIAMMATVIILSSNSSFAGGFINNPDRYPSIGFSLGMTDIEGGNTETIGVNTPLPFTEAQDTTLKTQDLTVDIRLPVSQAWTLFGAFSFFSQEMTRDGRTALNGVNQDLDGVGFRVGARYYFNR